MTSQSNITEIEIIQPDFHHFRDGDVLQDTVGIVADTFAYILAMPNIKPPVTKVQHAYEYHNRLCTNIPENTNTKILMTLYMTDNTSIKDIIDAKNSGIIYGIKLYPFGVTTNSSNGVTNIEKLYDKFKIMEKIGLPLLLHGEVNDKTIDIFDREKVFIDKILKPIINTYPKLKVVLEHITTKHGNFVLENPNVYATLLYTIYYITEMIYLMVEYVHICTVYLY